MNPFFNFKDLQGFMEQLGQPNMQGGMPMNGFNIQKQVMDAIHQYMPDFMKQGKHGPFSMHRSDYEVFETHDFVIARIPIPDNGNVQPRISMNTHTLYVKGILNRNEDLAIHLPTSIKPRHAKAEYRNGVLEVRMIKFGPEPTTEIRIDDPED